MSVKGRLVLELERELANIRHSEETARTMYKPRARRERLGRLEPMRVERESLLRELRGRGSGPLPAYMRREAELRGIRDPAPAGRLLGPPA